MTTILFLIDKLFLAGAQRNFFQLVTGLSGTRFRPIFVCLQEGGPLADKLLASGVEGQVLGLKRIYDNVGLQQALQLKGLIERRDVSIIHSYLTSANIYGTFVGKLLARNRPKVITTRRDLGVMRNWRVRWAEELFINPFVDRFVVVCDAVKKSLIREKGVNPDKVVTVYNGIDIEAFDNEANRHAVTREALQLEERDQMICTVANLTDVKGHHFLIKAFAQVRQTFPDTKLLLVGDGPLKLELQQLCESYGIRDRVLFLNSRSNVPALLRHADLCVLPSLTEGLSNALLEYMAAGKPVVATAIGGNVEVVVHGETGFLVPARDESSMAHYMRILLENQRLARQIGQAGRDRVSKDFSYGAMMSRYLTLYDNVCSERP